MQKIHKRALEHFDSLNTSISVPHPSDESNIKDTIKFLKNENNPLPTENLTTWALSHDWDPKFTQKVNEWLIKINSGGRVVIKHKNYGLSDKLKKELLLLK